MKTNRSNKGFTLVEILIVVVILGILAAIVIPQFSQASSDARISSVKSNLQMVRSQIELYKIQHGDINPTSTSEAALKACMTSKSDLDGTINASGLFGPYMQKFPANAVSGSDVVVIKAGAPAAGDVDATKGWLYDSTNVRIYAIHSLAALVTAATQY